MSRSSRLRRQATTAVTIARRAIGAAVAALSALSLLVSGPSGAAERQRVGTVEQVQARAAAVFGDRTWPLRTDSPVLFEDRLETGPESRLRAGLLDGSEVTLGALASLVVDAFVYAPADSAGALSLRVVEGAFLFVSGKMQVAALGEFCCASRPLRAGAG